ncbi:hypothetical protein ACMWP8_29230, partial [Escherichia coli]|uniref:hypothetical protein n=1 Tax=Escherichia coli TaxID=562 RepID=UPI0039DF2BCF
LSVQEQPDRRQQSGEDVDHGKPSRAFSSEVVTGSRDENASKYESRAPFRPCRNGARALADAYQRHAGFR